MPDDQKTRVDYLGAGLWWCWFCGDTHDCREVRLERRARHADRFRCRVERAAKRKVQRTRKKDAA